MTKVNWLYLNETPPPEKQRRKIENSNSDLHLSLALHSIPKQSRYPLSGPSVIDNFFSCGSIPPPFLLSPREQLSK